MMLLSAMRSASASTTQYFIGVASVMLQEDSAGTQTRSTTAHSARRVAPKKRQRTRARFLIAGLVIVAAIGYMIYAAMQSGSEYYMTAGELLAMGSKSTGQQVKLGGRVVDGTIKWDKGANTVAFTVTDGKQTLPVVYKGTVPDTFQADTDAILEGKMGSDGVFQASTMMTKCASKYEPK